MPVQSIMQDLLKNGIDFRSISDTANFRHSVSVIFQKYSPKVDEEAVFQIYNAARRSSFNKERKSDELVQELKEDERDDMENFMDKMLLRNGGNEMKKPSKSMYVKTIHADAYKKSNDASPSPLIKPEQQKKIS